LSAPRGYTHVVEVDPGRTLYLSGQIAVNQEGKVVGAGDVGAQTRQVFENIKAALASADATLDDIVKITVFMKDVSQLNAFRAVRDTYLTGNPPASSLVEISQLVLPDLLIEIDAIAVVGQR
jgi:reactive intermediate/imine deaminase